MLLLLLSTSTGGKQCSICTFFILLCTALLIFRTRRHGHTVTIKTTTTSSGLESSSSTSTTASSSSSAAFGESHKASRPDYHWDNDLPKHSYTNHIRGSTHSSISSSHSNINSPSLSLDMLKQKQKQIKQLRRDYRAAIDKHATSTTAAEAEVETKLMLRNLSFYKLRELREDLDQQPYTYIRTSQLSSGKLRVFIENVTETAFLAINRDFPEIKMNNQHETSIQRVQKWFSGRRNKHSTSQSEKTSSQMLLSQRNARIDEANRRKSNIFVAVIASPSMSRDFKDFHASMETIKNYCVQHQYTYELVDPEPIIEQYGAFLKLLSNSFGKFQESDLIKLQKSLVMLYTMRKLHQLQLNRSATENQDNWVMFLDGDVIIATSHYRIEDIIHHARIVLKSAACEVIAQLSPSTINTGVMLFKISDISDILVQQWIMLSMTSMIQKSDWQHEQGWFEYLYILYLERYIYSLHPFYDEDLDRLSLIMNCGFKLKSSRRGVRDVPLAIVRGRCFMRSLAILKALPVQYNLDGTDKNMFAGHKELHMCMLTGFEVSNHLHPSLSSIGLFNMHDWNGEDRFDPVLNNRYGFQILDTRSSNPIDIESENGACGMVQPLFYHGKNESTRSKILSMTKATEQTALLPVTNDGSCTQDLISLLRSNAQDKLWLSFGWEKKSQLLASIEPIIVDISS